MRPARRTFLAFAGSSAALIALPRFASALDYPTRAVHIVVGFAAAEKAAAELEALRSNERFHYRAVVTNLDPLKHSFKEARAYEQWRSENR